MSKTSYAVISIGIFAAFAILGNFRREPLKPAYVFKERKNIEEVHLLDDWRELAFLRLDCSNPYQCQIFDKIKKDLPESLVYLHEGFKLARSKKIDFIVIYHQTQQQEALGGIGFGNENPLQAEEMSQNMVVELLDYLDPDVVGLESCYEKCSAESEIEDAQRAHREFGIPIPARNQMLLLADKAWHIRLTRKYVKKPIVGADEFYIQLLDQILASKPLEVNPNWLSRLYSLRSEWAIARMGHLLNGSDKSGVVVMGYSHGKDFKNLAQALSLQSRIYIAVPEGIPLPKF